LKTEAPSQRDLNSYNALLSEPVTPARDLAAEVDELKQRIEELEKKK